MPLLANCCCCCCWLARRSHNSAAVIILIDAVAPAAAARSGEKPRAQAELASILRHARCSAHSVDTRRHFHIGLLLTEVLQPPPPLRLSAANECEHIASDWEIDEMLDHTTASCPVRTNYLTISFRLTEARVEMLPQQCCIKSRGQGMIKTPMMMMMVINLPFAATTSSRLSSLLRK